MDIDWKNDLEEWLEPFLGAWANNAPADVPCLCGWADRPWRSQERSADGRP